MAGQLTDNDKKVLCRVLAGNLSTLRAKASLSQDELAERLGFSRQTVNAIENGKREMQWSTFMAIVLFFIQDEEIRAVMEALEIFTAQLQDYLPKTQSIRGKSNMSIEQESFAPPIINANEPHMALTFVLDTSGSMTGDPIRNLNEGINRFKVEVCEDKQTRDILDVAILEFNTDFRVVQEFVPVEYMQEVSLEATGITNMSPAIDKALDMVNERSRFYRRSGSEPYKPWVILISDGAPSDDISSIVNKIKIMEEEGKLSFRSLGVEGYDPNTLHALSGPKVMKLIGTDFSSFFSWVNKSMRSVSQSSPGEKPKAEKLTGNVVVDTDWD